MEGRVGGTVGGRAYARLEEFEPPSQQPPTTSALPDLAKWTVSMMGVDMLQDEICVRWKTHLVNHGKLHKRKSQHDRVRPRISMFLLSSIAMCGRRV